jgi:hypothetical protein
LPLGLKITILLILKIPILIVASILFLAIGVAVAAALFGSMAMQSLTPINEVILSPQEKKCQEIANEGYKMHALYPEAHPDDLPEDDRKRLLYLDELWMNECVAVLPAESVFSIVNNVDRDVSHDE